MSPRTVGRQSLTVDQIVTTALKLIDETGLAGHSMRTLGARLGVDASTLYYHVPNKAALHSLIVDRIMSSVDLSGDDPSLTVEQRLMAAVWEFRRALLMHPRAVPLVAARSLRTITQLSGIEVVAGILYEAGFSSIEVLLAVDAIGQVVIGLTNIHAVQLEAAAEGEALDPLPELPEEGFANLRRLFAEGAYVGPDGEFEATLTALITGLISAHEAGTFTPATSQAVPLT